MDDLVAIRIVHGNTVTALIQRRSVAEETVRTLASDGRHLFHDVVGNPVLVDTSDGASAQLVGTPTGVPLADMLAPVPPSDEVSARCKVCAEMDWFHRTMFDIGLMVAVVAATAAGIGVVFVFFTGLATLLRGHP
jgi:hypothetical protein